MLRLHWLRGVSDVRPNILEHLLVCNHPATIDEEEQWRKSQTLYAVLGQLVVHGSWSFHVPGDDHSLSNVLVEIVDGSNWEESWHSDTVHHGNIGDIEHAGVLEVDNIVSTAPDHLELGHRGRFGLVRCSTIHLSLDEWDHFGGGQANPRKDEGVDEHGLHNLGANVLVPALSVVIVSAIEELSNSLRKLLTQVSVDQDEKDTSVEELGDEDTVGDRRQSLTERVLSDPCDQGDNDLLQDQVESNNDRSNRQGEDLAVPGIGVVVAANRDLLLRIVGILIRFRLSNACFGLHLAEALKELGVVGVAAFFFKVFLLTPLSESVNLKFLLGEQWSFGSFSGTDVSVWNTVLLGSGLASRFWVLRLESG